MSETKPQQRETGGRLNISLVTETYPPEINGVAMTLSQLAAQLEVRGHHLQLVRPQQEPERGDSRGVAETLLVQGMAIPGYRELRFGLPATRLLARRWRQRRPDVIYVATEGPLGWSAVQVARRLGIPAVSGFHTQFHHYSRYYRASWLQPLVYRYLKSLHNKTACTLVPTEAMRRSMSGEFAAVKVLGRGIDTTQFQPSRRCDSLRRKWGAEPDDKVFLYVGRLAREKNIPLVVETFRRLREQTPSARLVLVGHGPDYVRLYQRQEGVVFVGSRTGEELARHYASADIFLFPSMSETFGNVVLEAMASGLAVVAFDEAAAGIHIRHGHNGMLAEVEDRAAFIRHSQTLLANPAFLAGLRREARRAMEGIAWEQVGVEFERILTHYAGPGGSDESTGRLAADLSR
ncbi:MAG: glycosyltransferase family 4 protein [Pseudomonadota bacterium]